MLSILARALLLLALGAAAARPVAAEELAAEGMVIDLPSGFVPAEGERQTRFTYLSPDGQIQLDILIREPEEFPSAEGLAAAMLARLGSQAPSASFRYEGREAVIAELDFELEGVRRGGYALFLAAGSGYALLAHAPASRLDSAADFIMSCLDAFRLERAARRSPGPVSQFLLPWPAPRPGWKTVVLPDGPVALPWSPEEAEQELYTVQREYRILQTYLVSSLWKEAWARYYRMVYRESAGRLEGIVEALARALPAADPTESARRVLAWVQDFHYERDPSGLDFVPPLAAAFERRGDCDSRALVMAAVLEASGIDCVLMLSREYSHAMLAVDVPGGGQRFAFQGRQYLVAETTAKVGLGMIDSAQTDFSKWLGVELE